MQFKQSELILFLSLVLVMICYFFLFIGYYSTCVSFYCLSIIIGIYANFHKE